MSVQQQRAARFVITEVTDEQVKQACEILGIASGQWVTFRVDAESPNCFLTATYADEWLD